MIGKVQIPKNTKGMRAGTVTLPEFPWRRGSSGFARGKHFETRRAQARGQAQKLIPKVGRKKVEEWEAWIAEERWDEFVEDILINHYDTAHAGGVRGGRDDEAAEFLMLPDTEDETYADAAAELIRKYDVSVPPPRRTRRRRPRWLRCNSA